MYRILLVNQDEDNLNNIRNIITNNIRETLIVYAFSGVQALEIMRKEKIDIVFLTIELMDISGIDVAEEIMKEERSPKVVFVSQYDYFEFARKAIQIGVSDYLIEPFSEHDLIETTNRLINELIKDRKDNNKKEMLDRQIADYKELIGYSFIYTVLFDGRTNKDNDEYRKILEISDKGFWINIEFENRIYDIGLNNYNVSNSIKNILLDECRYIIGPKILNRYIVYISIPDDEYKVSDKTFSTRIADMVKIGLERKYKYKVNIGIGSTQKLDRLYVSYEESIRSLRCNIDKQIVHIQECLEDKGFNHDLYINHEKKLLESIELGKDDVMDEFSALLDDFFSLNIYDRRNKIMEALVLVCHTINKLGSSECDYLDFSKYFEEFSIIPDDEINAWAVNKFQYIIKSSRSNAVDKVSDIVKTAIYYVYEHYDENITLNAVAGMAGVTLQYFSKIFKDETGMNFIEWLNRLRVNKAKELMNNSQFTVKEVCFKVGYNDPNYFSRIFKRYEGIAPTEYLGRKENVG